MNMEIINNLKVDKQAMKNPKKLEIRGIFLIWRKYEIYHWMMRIKDQNTEYRDKDRVNGVCEGEYRDLPAYEESSSNMAMNASFDFLGRVLLL